jgi:hypothetical protein
MKLTDRPAVTVTAMLTLGAHEVAEACAGQAAAGCTPLSDGEASAEYLRP